MPLFFVCAPKTWIALSYRAVIGPFWFQDEKGKTTTVASDGYLTGLRKFWRSLGRRSSCAVEEAWFQQDGATPHTSRVVLAWLQERFGKRLISRKLPNEWPQHSPDLNPLDYFLWGFLKDGNKPQTIQELKLSIEKEVQRIYPETCHRVVQNFQRRIRACLERNGQYLEHIV